MIGTEPTRRRPCPSITHRLAPLAFMAALLLVVAFGSSAMARTAAKPGQGHSRRQPSSRSHPSVAAVPPGFVGVDGDGPLFSTTDALNFDHQAKAMTAAGVESLRVAFNWASAQPYPNFNDVPVGQALQYTNVAGVPTDFTRTDAIVRTAARHGIVVFPTILYAAPWDATLNQYGVSTPTDPAPYAAYAVALVNRYGPRGSFWRLNPGLPKVPIRMWQIWNEPNIPYYWPQPFAQGYRSLLGPAHAAIKHADPGAQVVLAALTNAAWISLGQLRGAKQLFDVAAVNGFTKTPAAVILYLRLMRRAMNALGYGKKPLLGTELSWPSAAGRHTDQTYDFDVTASGQARNISQLLPMLVQQRKSLGLLGFYYYTWVGDESPGHHQLAFDYAGLVGYSNHHTFPKPALRAFTRGALAIEQCKRKSKLATTCAKPAF